MNRDINSGHSRRKWKWLKIIFGFLKKRWWRDEQKETRHETVRQAGHRSGKKKRREEVSAKIHTLSTV